MVTHNLAPMSALPLAERNKASSQSNAIWFTVNGLVAMPENFGQLLIPGVLLGIIWVGLITALGAWFNSIIIFWSAITFGVVGVALWFDVSTYSSA